MPNLFRRGVDALLQFFVRKVAGRVVAAPIRRRLALFEEATHRPREVQEALLHGILARHKDTAFGRDHHFDAIRTLADFRRQVPVAGYEYVEPYIARVRRGELDALLADRRVHMFALTSGTTAARKYIPVTDQYLADYKRGWNIWGLKAFRDHTEVSMRPIVQMSGDWDEIAHRIGHAVRSRDRPDGPDAETHHPLALLRAGGGRPHQGRPREVLRRPAAEPAVAGRHGDRGQPEHAHQPGPHRRPGEGIAASRPDRRHARRPSRRAGRRARGTAAAAAETPGARAASWRRSSTGRGRSIRTTTGRPHCLLGNWTGGSVGAYLRHYPRYFGDFPVRDVGLIASEGRMTIPLADGTPAGVLDVTSHYFEFIPEEEEDSPQPTVLAAHEVLEGRNYFILPTTAYGLYRYDIHDVVRVTGFHNRTPLVEFLSKGAHFANVTGEKLSEYHVTRAMARVLGELDLTLTSYSLAPCWDDEQPYYGLFVERGDGADAEEGRRLAERLDALLKEGNIEYAAKRDSLRLGAVRLELLEAGAWREWDRERLKRSGGTLEQYKHPCLIADLKFREQMTKRRAAVVG